MKNTKFTIKINNSSEVLDSNDIYRKLIELFGKERATKIMYSCEIYGSYEITSETQKITIKKIID